MSNPVDVQDVADRWRPLTDAEVTTASAYLDDAWEELLYQIPDIEDRLGSGALRRGLVVSKVAAVVKAVMQNPDGYVEESIDDWRGRRDSSSGGRVQFSEDDLAALREGLPTPSARTVRMGW